MPDLTDASPRQEPALASLPVDDPDDRSFDARPRAHAPFPWLPVAALCVVAAAAIVFWRMQEAPPPPRAPEAAPPLAAPPAAAEMPPPIRYPIDAARASDEAPLPAEPALAADPNAALLAGLLAVPGATGMDRLLMTDNLVHRFVATVDNLPRTSVASKVMAVRAAEGAFAVDTGDGRSVVGRGNAARYAPYVRALQMVDVKPLVALYVRNYALFQQAYRDLGYPNGYFNDRLIDVIDHLLATPDVVEPPTVLQPRVLYEYANPDLEARSAGQKAMLRLGPDDEHAAKAKLRALRQALTGAAPEKSAEKK
jgi:hypothetical protein